MELDVTALLSIGIVGAALSGAVEILKGWAGTDSTMTKFMTIGLAIVVGMLVWSAFGTPLWAAIMGILGVSQVVYAFLLK